MSTDPQTLHIRLDRGLLDELDELMEELDALRGVHFPAVRTRSDLVRTTIAHGITSVRGMCAEIRRAGKDSGR